MSIQSLKSMAKSAAIKASSKRMKQRPSPNAAPVKLKKKSPIDRKRKRKRKRVTSRNLRYYRRRRIAPKIHPVNDKQTASLDHGMSYEQGVQEGLNLAGERILVEHLPTDLIIPDITIREAVAAGVQALRARGVPLIDSSGVYQELEDALRERRPYAFIRLGDGELLTLAQEKVLTTEEIRGAGKFLPYAGVTIPNLGARDELAACIRAASLIGVPMSRHPHFQPLLFAVLRAHGIDYQKLRLTTSTMNYTLEELGLLTKLLSGRKILVIGDVAIQLKQVLVERGMEIAGVVTPVRGYADVPRVVAEASSYDYDIALVAAGIAAIPICIHLAKVEGKVTFDFGHLANRMAGLERPARSD